MRISYLTFIFTLLSAPNSVLSVKRKDGTTIYKERKNNGRSMMEENQWKMMGDSCIYADDSTTILDFGHSISTSSNGKVLAISAPNNGFGVGFVRIMSYNPMTNSFVQHGNDIQGEYGQYVVDRSGSSISISSNGSIIAIGTSTNTNENGFFAGNVRIFRFDGPNNDWVQIGNSILGESEHEYFGHLVELSNDGKTVLVGSKGGNVKPKVLVFTFDAQAQNWLQKGTNLNVYASSDAYCGRSLALSGSNANIVAMGCSFPVGTASSLVKIYEYDSSSNVWSQINELEGPNSYKFGHDAVSLSDDGKILAVGSSFYSEVDPLEGRVEIFKYNESTQSWDQMGYIVGESEYDESGEVISLSSDGKIVSISSKSNDDGGLHSGHVRVFEYDEVTGNWIQLGSNLDGLHEFATFGHSVSLSADGMILAASSINSDPQYVCVYSYLPLSLPWTQVGQNIYGSSEYEDSGFAVSLSSDGKTVAVGSPRGANYNGFVRVFSLDISSSNWIQKGNNIEGENIYDQSGDSLSLSGNGQVVAIGSAGNSDAALSAGHVRVFLYDTETDTFNQIGSDIDGEAEFDWAGYSMSLSENGMIIAVGSPQVGGYPNPGGKVRVFSYDASSNAWQQIGNSISGESAEDSCGASVSISSDGSRVAMGSPGDGTKSSGQVRIFSYDSSSDQWVQVGQNIDCDDYDFIGWSVSLSNDGDSVAIGSSASRGGSVYRLNPSSQSWVQVGDTPLASDDNDYYYCGRSVSLSGDGQTLGVGCIGGHWSIGDAGYVRIYTYVASLDEFKQVRSKITGEESFEQSGASISLSEDGTIVAIGSPNNSGANGDEYYTGLTRIFYGYGIPYIDDGPGPTPGDGPNPPNPPNPPVSAPTGSPPESPTDSPPESPSESSTSVTVSPPDTSAPVASPSSSGTADCAKSNLMKLLYSKLIRQ